MSTLTIQRRVVVVLRSLIIPLVLLFLAGRGRSESQTLVELTMTSAGIKYMAYHVQHMLKEIPGQIELPPNITIGPIPPGVTIIVVDPKLIKYDPPLVVITLLPEDSLAVKLRGGGFELKAGWWLGDPKDKPKRVWSVAMEDEKKKKKISEEDQVVIEARMGFDRDGKPDASITKCEIEVPLKVELAGNLFAKVANLGNGAIADKIESSVRTYACAYLREYVKEALDFAKRVYVAESNINVDYRIKQIIVGREDIRMKIEADLELSSPNNTATATATTTSKTASEHNKKGHHNIQSKL